MYLPFLFISCNVHSTEDATIQLVTEAEFFAEIPSIKSVTRLPQPKSETPAAVSIIDSDMIRASGARDLADLFRLIPGFQVAYPRAHRPTVTYHGLGDEYSRRMQILIDGRSVYNAFLGHVSWSSQAIAIEDIERIEVVRGPNSVTYGANAFLGTINIITRNSVQTRGTSVKVSAGDHDIRDALLRFGTGFNSGDIRITAGYLSDDGLKVLPDENKTKFINLRSDIQPSSRDSILVQLGLSRADSGEGFYNHPELPPTIAGVSAHFEQLRWKRQFAVDNELSVQFYHNYRDVDYSYLTDPINLGPPFGSVQIPVSFDDTTERYDLELQHTLSPLNNWRFVWGAGIRQDKVESPALFATAETVTTNSSRLFGNAEWRLTPETIINAGAMLEDSDFTGTHFSPRLAVNYHINKDHTLRAILSRAQRKPSLFEEFGDFRIYYQNALVEHQFNSLGGLLPETMTTYELGYLGRLAKTELTYDIRLYRDKITDFISEVRIPAVDLSDGTAFSYRNEGEITINGIDLEVIYRLNKDNRIILNLAYMDAAASEVSNSAVEAQKDRINSVPDYSGNLLLMHRFYDRWYGSLGYYFVSDMLWLSDGDMVSSYQRLDLRLARRFNINESRGEIALVVQNLGNDYDEFNIGNVFDTRTFVTLELEF